MHQPFARVICFKHVSSLAICLLPSMQNSMRWHVDGLPMHVSVASLDPSRRVDSLDIASEPTTSSQKLRVSCGKTQSVQRAPLFHIMSRLTFLRLGVRLWAVQVGGVVQEGNQRNTTCVLSFGSEFHFEARACLGRPANGSMGIGLQSGDRTWPTSQFWFQPKLANRKLKIHRLTQPMGAHYIWEFPEPHFLRRPRGYTCLSRPQYSHLTRT